MALDQTSLQVEDGNFTRIINPLIEGLVQLPFKGCELAVCLFIIRKTYGFGKIEDEISLSQFCLGTKRSKQTIVTALKNLQLVKVIRLVKKGDSKKHSNLWSIEKNPKKWELVTIPRLVKRIGSTSLKSGTQLVNTPRHTKETTKESNTKEITPSGDVQKVFQKFYDTVNPNINFGNVHQRKEAQWLIEHHGIEKILNAVEYSHSVSSDRYAPSIATPSQLREKMAALVKHKLSREKTNETKGIRI